MLLFTRPSSTHGVKSFELSVKPGGLDTLVAFGPGSVLNGKLVNSCVPKERRTREILTICTCQALLL